LSGKLQGKVITNENVTYFSFKGIPYAEPPVGKLRFQAPEPVIKWNGVKSAFNHGSFCANKFGFFGVSGTSGGAEDCLFLNIYTPSTCGNRPVMFWIPGGGYVSGNGDALFYGPEHLLKKDVVVVTVNYRLGVFGFLSTGDENAPGNQGLKDLVLSLTWIQNNIAKFGGDPNQVTIFGHSAGSAAVSYLLLSESANGLFNKAIMQSGSGLMSCLNQLDPLTQAQNLAARLNVTYTSNNDLINKLQDLDFQAIVDVETFVFDMGNPFALGPFEFVPSIEPVGTKDAIFTEDPLNILIDGRFKRIPVMTGNPSNEATFFVPFLGQPTTLPYLNANPKFIVPLTLNLDPSSHDFQTVTSELQQLYFNGSTVGTLQDWINIESDYVFRYSADRFFQYYAQDPSIPLYYYQFSYIGSLNFMKIFLQLDAFEGAAHCDELFYMWLPELPGFVPNDDSIEVREKVVRMWTNFAKFG
jgi:acetylcholinesterase